ncbi:unnamed protein product [Durusdinium trenchii]|uniref:ArsA/GET3 Anion-transporting ATPase-like domain-containing protein n=1 Tax=Durusdinium trenchii TaxID=1381693 RepID=A0ABP0PB77_9DINO
MARVAPPSLQNEGTSWPEVVALQAQVRSKEAELFEMKRRLRALTQQNSPSGVRPVENQGQPLSVIIPMGGSGSEFAEAGFRMPKPLVNIVGRPVLLWVLDHLGITKEDSIFLAVPAPILKQYDVQKMLARMLPQVKVKIVVLPFETRGWLETVLSVARQMNAKESRNRLVTLDSSSIYHGVDLLHLCRCSEARHASVYVDLGQAPVTGTGLQRANFSYLKLADDGKILEVKEKSVISSLANCGTYIFSSAVDFRVAAEALLECPEEAGKGGLYASSLMNWMMSRGEDFFGIPVSCQDVALVSTPPQLDDFVRRVSSGQVPVTRKMRFCFDLDSTLVHPNEAGQVDPIPAAVELVRQLSRSGHTIIITTSRGMAMGGGADRAIAEQGHDTFQLLKQLDIPYDELHFGKPYADITVDAHAINSQGDLSRELGWYVGQMDGQMLEGAIDARSFNTVRSSGKSLVIKSSSPDVLKGECHWYRSIPPELACHFPQAVDIQEGDASKDSSLSTITMSKVVGVTFSHLVTARLLMPEWLRRLVRTLRKIHVQQPPEDSQAAREARVSNAQLCSNYGPKVKKRALDHIALYDSLAEELGINTRQMADVLIRFLEDFESSERAVHAHYIHGDPVFSNVIRTNDDQIMMIDMRGQLGKVITTQGDVHYDLSKVFQSLCGYDFMLLDQTLDEPASETFDSLRAAFWEEVKELYPEVSHRQVRLLTASHFFTIVPLHEIRSRMARYLRPPPPGVDEIAAIAKAITETEGFDLVIFDTAPTGVELNAWRMEGRVSWLLEELQLRLHVLQNRLQHHSRGTRRPGPGGGGCPALGAALERLGEAYDALREAEAQPRVCSDEDRLDEIGLSPDVSGSGQPMRSKDRLDPKTVLASLNFHHDSGHLTAAGFGGPWLPRRLGEALEELLLRLEMCRRDRTRYFDQVLECRELITLQASRPRGARPPPAAAFHRFRLGVDGTEFQSIIAHFDCDRRFEKIVASRTLEHIELTSSDPAILSLDRGRSPGAPFRERRDGSAPSHDGESSTPKAQDALSQHLEVRRELERQLTFWEAETLKLCERRRRAEGMLRWAWQVAQAREELDQATFSLLALMEEKLTTLGMLGLGLASGADDKLDEVMLRLVPLCLCSHSHGLAACPNRASHVRSGANAVRATDGDPTCFGCFEKQTRRSADLDEKESRRVGLILMVASHCWCLAAPARAKPQAILERTRRVQVPPLDPREAPKSSPARQRIWRARKTLQAIDKLFVELLEEDRGQALRRELLKVISDLGPIEELAQALVEEPGVVNDPDAVLQKTDVLGRALRLSVAWSNEADDCWNWSCNVQELDEARSNYLDAIDILLDLEDF